MGKGGGGEGGREMEANGHRGRGEGMGRKGMEGGVGMLKDIGRSWREGGEGRKSWVSCTITAGDVDQRKHGGGLNRSDGHRGSGKGGGGRVSF